MEAVLDRIVKRRKELKISQKDIAHRLNLSQASYTKIEKGETKLSLDRFFIIAQILDKEVGDLLGLESKYNQDIHNNTNPTIIAHQEIENQYLNDKDTINKLLRQYEEALESKNKLIVLLENRIKEISVNQ